jgi:diphthamide synthase (EF-2-diphthine--ammonia ligase)
MDIGDIQLHFPLWKKPYGELQDLLFGSGAKVTISACTKDFGGLIRVGMNYTSDFIKSLPDECDKFGESGEFHTLVSIRN